MWIEREIDINIITCALCTSSYLHTKEPRFTFSINQILLLQPEGDEKKEISFGDESSKIGCRFWPKSFRTEGECEIIIIMYL